MIRQVLAGGGFVWALSAGFVPAVALDLPYTPPEQLAPPADWFVQACINRERLFATMRDPFKANMDRLTGKEQYQPSAACLAEWKPAMAAHSFNDQQGGYVWLWVDGAGTATLAARFSNGEKWQGETGMSVVVRFADKDGTPIHAAGFRSAVGGAEFKKGSNEENVLTTFKLDPAQWARVASVIPEWHTFMTAAQMQEYLSRNTAPRDIPLPPIPQEPTTIDEGHEVD